MKRHAPATARNSEPLAKILDQELPGTGLVLEVASGSGEHAVFMARHFPRLTWQPSDLDGRALDSVAAWREEAGLANLCEPFVLDAASDRWPIESADALLCVNMIHISQWDATEGLFRNATHLLPPGAPLIVYGPFFEDEVETAPSNNAFDADLRRRNPEWGLRNVDRVDALGVSSGFARTARHEMPANNLTLVYRKP